MKNKRKILLIVIGLLLVGCISIGISYAWWSASITQESTNTIMSDCLNIDFIEDNDAIYLDNAFPLTDEEAKKLTPYQFTIKNTCNLTVAYDVNLEILENEKRLASTFVSVSLNEAEKRVLTDYEKVEPTIGVENYKIQIGTLAPKKSVSYTIKLWLDESATTEDDVMNKKFKSKIVVNGSLTEPIVIPKEGVLAEYLTNLAETTNELVFDGTTDNNLRYVGKNPNNYIKFNNELWRIIGVMNNVENENGDKETRVKIIRSEALGEFAWDLNPGPRIGYNNWNNSQLKSILDQGYYKQQHGVYYEMVSNDGNTTLESLNYDFTSIGLNEEAKEMMQSAVWYLGSPSDTDYNSFYNEERSENVYQNNPTRWVGNVGLIYPSDYLYAVGETDNLNRTNCLNFADWTANSCYQENWLNINEMRTITASKFNQNDVWTIYHNGIYKSFADYLLAHKKMTISPVVYLKNEVNILSGEGTQNEPFEIE